MTVNELIAVLQEVENKDEVVILSSDDEGNNYRLLDEVTEAHCILDGRNAEVYAEEDAVEYNATEIGVVLY